MANDSDDLRSQFNFDEDDESEEVYEPEAYDEAGYEDESYDEEPVEEEQSGGNTLRLILLALVTLVLLCVVCFLLLRFGLLPVDSISGLIGGGVDQVTPAEQQAPTDQPAPDGIEGTTEAVEAPAEGTAEPDGAVDSGEAVEGDGLPGDGAAEATDEAPLDGTAEPPTDGASEDAPDEAEDSMAATDEAGEGMVDEHGEDVVTDEADGTAEDSAEAGPTVAITIEPGTTPVPGPTVTPGPTVVITIQPDCTNNTPPTADAGGPYQAMLGKGQAILVVDGSGSTDPDGSIDSYEWDFGDGNSATGETATNRYGSTGSYTATLTITDDCGDSDTDTADVTITGATPPAPTPTDQASAPPVTATPMAVSGTEGFCHRVVWGETLTGIAARYGTTLHDLATVNVVPMHYFVIAGQGVFIPTSQIVDGPNVYRVKGDEDFYDIAYQCGLSPVHLANFNEMTVNANLSPDQTIIIPPWRY